jgi:hypothetical protein
MRAIDEQGRDRRADGERDADEGEGPDLALAVRQGAEGVRGEQGGRGSRAQPDEKPVREGIGALDALDLGRREGVPAAAQPGVERQAAGVEAGQRAVDPPAVSVGDVDRVARAHRACRDELVERPRRLLRVRRRGSDKGERQQDEAAGPERKAAHFNTSNARPVTGSSGGVLVRSQSSRFGTTSMMPYMRTQWPGKVQRNT